MVWIWAEEGQGIYWTNDVEHKADMKEEKRTDHRGGRWLARERKQRHVKMDTCGHPKMK